MNTLLTSPLTSEEMKALEGREQLWDKAHVIALNIWLEGYKAGDIGFERMCIEVNAALTKITLPERQKQLLLGIMVNTALASPPPKRIRGGTTKYPASLKKISTTLVNIVATKEGLSKSRYSPDISAYERASQVLNECGFEVPANTLINWYSEFHPS